MYFIEIPGFTNDHDHEHYNDEGSPPSYEMDSQAFPRHIQEDLPASPQGTLSRKFLQLYITNSNFKKLNLIIIHFELNLH